MGATSSKTVFVEIVRKLLTEDVDPNEHEFWDDLWKTALTVEDIFEVISADDVRQLIKNRPTNIKTLFTQAVAQLYQVGFTLYQKPLFFYLLMSHNSTQRPLSRWWRHHIPCISIKH